MHTVDVDPNPINPSNLSKMPGWTKRDVRDLIHARASGGGTWELTGSIVALGTGRTLANLHGIEEVIQTSRLQAIRPTSTQRLNLTQTDANAKPARLETHAATLRVRTTLFYTTETGAPMRSFRLGPTRPKRVVRAGILGKVGTVRVGLEEGGGLVVTRGGEGREGRCVRVGEGPGRRRGGLLLAGWTFVGRRVGKEGAGRPGVVERYDYAVDGKGGMWSWVRVGRCPVWYGRGDCVSFVKARRVDGGWRGVDERVRGWMRKEGRDKPLGWEEKRWWWLF